MPGVSFEAVKKTAKVIKEIFDKLELRSYPKLSGSSGIQVFLPLKPNYSYKEARIFAIKVMKITRETLPEITTMKRKVKERESKVYLDYLQNVKGKTISVVYGPRPLEGAPVSFPIKWEELDDPEIKPGKFNIFNIFHRIDSMGELFSPVLWDKQEIDNLL